MPAPIPFRNHAREVLECAFGFVCKDHLSAAFVFQHFYTVEPVFDVFASHVDASFIPFTNRSRLLQMGGSTVETDSARCCVQPTRRKVVTIPCQSKDSICPCGIGPDLRQRPCVSLRISTFRQARRAMPLCTGGAIPGKVTVCL